jgi:hypothetical protein
LAIHELNEFAELVLCSADFYDNREGSPRP